MTVPVRRKKRPAPPARLALYAKGLTIRDAAEQIGVPFAHLANVLKGSAVPNQIVRDRLPDLVGARLEDLFDADVLAKQWQGTNNYAAKKAGGRSA
jgi:hypothetical protein